MLLGKINSIEIEQGAKLGKRLLLILGNGFTLDFLKHIEKNNEIDVSNLFRHGAEVPWPITGAPGFLSFKHCPNLWNLGARPTMDDSSAMNLIEDVITCINVYASQKRPLTRPGDDPNIYILAYKELMQYLKHLFIFYNNKIDSIPDNVDSWAWLKFLTFVAKSDAYSEITIVTYNYDIWLERLLNKTSIKFHVGVLEDSSAESKITILKPHGSISFTHYQKLDRESYSINTTGELLDGKPADFKVTYTDLAENYLISALIPPAGDSSRFNHTWAGQIKAAAKDYAKGMSSNDEVIICGMSYWHVDRAELDELFVNLDPMVNIAMLNPNPQRSMNAVLASIFKNYVSYYHSRTLEVLCQQRTA